MLSSTVFQNFDIVKYSIFIEGVLQRLGELMEIKKSTTFD